MSNTKKTRVQYEEYLNSISPPIESIEWVMDGKRRKVMAKKQKYGTALRNHDPLQFNNMFNQYNL